MFTRVINEFNFPSAGGHPYSRLPSVLLQNVPRPGHFRPLLKARVRDADFNFFKRYVATKPFATATYSPPPNSHSTLLDPADEWSHHRSVGFHAALVRLNLGKHRQNNWQEWIGGSNLTNRHSFFAISGVALSPNSSNVVIQRPNCRFDYITFIGLSRIMGGNMLLFSARLGSSPECRAELFFSIGINVDSRLIESGKGVP